MSKPIGIVAAGSWGSALATALAESGHDVLVWSPEKDVVKEVNKKHTNSHYLPGISLSERIVAEEDLIKVSQQCETLLITSPAEANTELAASLNGSLTENHTIVLASKGLRETDGALMSEVWQEAIPNLKNIAILTGPCFALELAQKNLSTFIVASEDKALTAKVADLFDTPYLRVYYSEDIIGAQIGGAMKSLLAIAVGISDALELGNNFRASVLCRGIAEIMRFAQTKGADPQTISGLSGLGDVLLNASSPLSRNYRFGRLLGKGVSVSKALEAEPLAIEAVRVARIVTAQGISSGTNLAIIGAIDGILSGDIKAKDAFKLLFDQPNKWEF